MVKLYIIAEGTKINIELESVDISSEEFKKIIEKNMAPDKAIPFDKQSVFINKNKLADDKKLSEYIKEDDTEVKVFVLRKSNNVLSSNKQTQNTKTGAPTNNPYGNPPPRNPYEGMQNLQVPNWGYPSPNQSFNQQHPPGFGYGSPGQGFSQMPPMNNLITKEQIDMLLNNPQFIEQIVSVQSPNATPAEREASIKMYKDCLKMLQNDPNLMNNLNSMAPDMLRGGMMPPQPLYNHQPPFPPPQAPTPYGYPSPYGMPQPGYNPYYQQQYPGYPPYGMPHHGVPTNQHPPMSPSHYEDAYAPQLKALEEMGFTDRKANLEALVKANGDINAALDYIRNDANFKSD